MKIRDIVFCDDIRNEINNKSSLMGVYGDSIIFQFKSPQQDVTWPVSSRLALMIRLTREIDETIVDKFKFKYRINSKEFPTVEGILLLRDDQTVFSINIIADGLPLDKGNLGFELELYSREKLISSYLEDKAIQVISKKLD